MMQSQLEPDGERSMVPGFRAIAICADQSGIEAACQTADLWSDVRFGLMLRDPDHDPSRVEMLVRYLLHRGVPPNIDPISNGAIIPSLPYVHFTTSQLHQAEAVLSGPIRAGYSTHSLREATRASSLGAEYITFSPLFPTRSKPGHAGVGLESLREVCEHVPIPVFALGGIDAGNVAECLRAGAFGIASISLFARGSRPELFRTLEILHRTTANPE